MRTKHFFAVALAAVFAASCSNEEFAEMQNGFSGKMMDASSFQLVGTRDGGDATRLSYNPQYVTIDGTTLGAVPTQAVWENDDEVGFSHIYTDNKIITNYRFEIDPLDVGSSDAAEFTTTNSTIFEGDYFVYYPFNDQYADYDGIPLTIDAIQNQDAATPLKVITKPAAGVDPMADPTFKAVVKAAGDHLPRFSVSNRTTAAAHTTQTEFALKQYTSYLGFVIYPKNQTNDINVKRIEMVSATNTPLEIPVSVRFNVDETNSSKAEAALAGENATTSKMILLFDKIDAVDGAGGLTIDKNATVATASLGYMGMLPATYAKGTYKFVVYYTENSILKKREITKDQDLVLESNKPQFVTLEVDANGATEVTDYQIYNETEFASAVVKSNAITNGEVTFEIMNDFTLTNNYELKSEAPVTFNGDKTVEMAEGRTLTFNSSKKINFNNVIASEDAATSADVIVSKGDVTIKSINSDKLNLTVAASAKATILNAEKQGTLASVENNGALKLENVKVSGSVSTASTADASLELKNAEIGDDFSNGNGTTKGKFTLEGVAVTNNFTNNTTETAANSLKNVVVHVKFTNTKGKINIDNLVADSDFKNSDELNVTGTNTFAYDTTTGGAPVSHTVTNTGTINFTSANVTLGHVKQQDEGRMNLGATATDEVVLTAKGETDLKSSGSGALINVNTKAVYNAEQKLDNLKGDGTVSGSTMILEGKLTTNGVVTLIDDFKICGVIENKSKGSWTLNKANENYGVFKFDHAHATEPEFSNAGEVIVMQVANKDASDAINTMGQELYKANGGRLEWKGIESFADVDGIVGMNAECFATDLCVVLPATNSSTATDYVPADWSAKNIIVQIDGASEYSSHKIRLKSNAQIKAKNFTVRTNAPNSTLFEIRNGKALEDGGAVRVTEKITLQNINGGENKIDLLRATCKDIEVTNAVDKKFEIRNGQDIEYKNTYSTGGAGVKNISYPNNIPTKK